MAKSDGEFQHLKKTQRAFLVAFCDTGNVSESARAAKIDRSTHYKWMLDSEYAKAFQIAEAIAADELEAEARKRAKANSDTLLIFLLKGLKPERYSDRRKVEHSGPGGEPLKVGVIGFDG